MRIQSTIADLNQRQWAIVQEMVRTQYEFPSEMATRVCAVFKREALERHAQMPMAEYSEVMALLSMDGAVQAAQTMMAALTPDDAALDAKLAPGELFQELERRRNG